LKTEVLFRILELNNMKILQKIVPFLTAFLFSTVPAVSQKGGRALSLEGYVSSLQSVMFDSLSGPVTYENIIHNRLNFRLRASSNLLFGAEIRNRLFTGDMAKRGSSYSSLIADDHGWADMSWNIIEKNSFFLNTTIDRLWAELNFHNVEIRVGRQRINWGQTLVWNPNDIFNSYSFFDFDYIERPGSDAVCIRYYSGPTSTVEAAVKLNSVNKLTAVGLWRFNKGGYDIQFIGGYSEGSDIVAGTGWSGSLGKLSFRGEGTWFIPAGNAPDSTGKVIITAGLEKNFSDNSMVQVQLMYCNNPITINNFSGFYSGSLSAKDLAFSKFTAFGQVSWATTPLLNLGASAMWFPSLSGYYAGPSVDYSLSDNLGLSLIWQHFSSMMGGSRTRINIGFLRLKMSF